MTCLAIDKEGDYCAGGTSQGRIYLWEVISFSPHIGFASTHSIQISSGILFNSWDAHYRRVNVLKFTNDGSILISGSEDSSVNVWLVQRCLILSFYLPGCRAQQFNLDSLTTTHKMICRHPASPCLIIHYLSQISSAALVPH